MLIDSLAMGRRLTRFGVFELDADALELRRGRVPLRLSGKPLQVLAYLVERQGELVTRGELQRALWGDDTFVEFDHGLNNAVNKLRAALGDSPAAPRFIETIPRRGYRFVAPVEIVPGPSPAEGAERRRRPARWHVGVAVVLAAAFSVAAIATIAMQRERASSRASAHEAYVKGREEIAAGDAESIARAREYFERAIRLDAAYAPAHCGLAIAWNRVGIGGVANPDLAHRRALEAAERALSLDPALAEAYVARATARIRLSWDWGGAEADLRRAIALDPDFVKPHQTWAQLLAARGEVREALREIATARQLDPLSMALQRDEAIILYYGRQYRAAIERFRGVLAADPRDATARRMLSDAYLHSHDADAARHEFLLWLKAVGVDDAEVERARANLEEGGFPSLWKRLASGTRAKSHAYKLAVAHAGLGQRDEAIAALYDAFRNRESQLLYLKTDPYLDPLRSDARFTALLARAGL